MVRPNINVLIDDIVLEVLKQSMSYKNIVKQVKQMVRNVFVATVHPI